MSPLLLSSSIRGRDRNSERGGGGHSFSKLKLHYFFGNRGKCNKVKAVATRNNAATISASRKCLRSTTT